MNGETPPPDQDNPAWLAQANFLTALVFVVLGIAIVWLSWNMPRLEVRRIHPATIPALVPLLLGGALTLCGGLLALGSWRQLDGREGWAALGRLFTGMTFVRVATLTALVLVYTLGLIGLMPFWLAAAVFITAFIVIFEVYLSDTPRPLLTSLMWGVGQGLIIGIAVTLMFERGFLVRLP